MVKMLNFEFCKFGNKKRIKYDEDYRWIWRGKQGSEHKMFWMLGEECSLSIKGNGEPVKVKTWSNEHTWTMTQAAV